MMFRCLNDDKKIMFLICWDFDMCYTPSAFVTSIIHLTFIWELSKINLFSEGKCWFTKGLEKKETNTFFFHGFIFFCKCSFEAAQGSKNSAKRGDGAQEKQRRMGKALWHLCVYLEICLTLAIYMFFKLWDRKRELRFQRPNT